MSRTTLLAQVTFAAALALPASAVAAWNEPVGGPSPINRSTDDDAASADLTTIGGRLHVAWVEGAPGAIQTQVRVGRLNDAGTDWEELVGGTQPINEAANGSANSPSLADVAGTPYVAWAEGVYLSGQPQRIYVSRLNPAGTVWQRVGGPLNHGNFDASTPTLAVLGGVPWIAWSESDGSNVEIRVARLNQAGTGWEEVGPAANPINVDPLRDSSEPELAVVAGVPHVTWAESDGTNTEIRVAKVNQAGTGWQLVGSGASPINHAPDRNASDPSITDVGGVPWVSWEEDDGTNFELRASRFDAASGAWQEVAGGDSPINQAPDRTGYGSDLKAIGGDPYVTWQEQGLGGRVQIRVSTPNAAGTAWHQVVGGARPVNRNADRSAASPALADVGGVPHLAWGELDGNVELHVARLEPELTEPEAVATDAGAVLLTRARTFNVRYPIVFDYGTGSTLDQRSPTVRTDGLDGTDTIYTRVTGLTPATAHSFRAAGWDGVRTIAPGTSGEFTTVAATPPQVQVQTVPGPSVPGPATIEIRTNTITRLLVAVVNTKLAARSGKRVSVDYVSTAGGSATLEVLRGRTRVARVTGAARLGRNTLRWNGKDGRKKAKPGRYTLRLMVARADGQTADDSARLTVKK